MNNSNLSPNNYAVCEEWYEGNSRDLTAEDKSPIGNYGHRLIQDSIGERRSIEIRYKDDDKPRHFDPYVFYQHTGTGNYLIHGLQTLDPNKPEFQPKRRTFNLAEIQSVEMSERHFEPENQF